MSKISKVIYLVEVTFAERDFLRFGLEILSKSEFIVEVWNLTKFINPLYESQIEGQELFLFQGLKRFDSFKSFSTSLSTLTDDSMIISLLGFGPRYHSIYRAISEADIKYGMVKTNSLPPVRHRRNFKEIKKVLLRPSKIIGHLYAHLPFLSLRINGASFVLLGGKYSLPDKFPITKNTHRIWAHTLDYDQYLRRRNEISLKSDKKYAVFLDENIPFHPDYSLYRVEAPSKPESYFSSLTRFFDIVERDLECEIVIAAHPRSKYKEHLSCFGGRKVYINRTFELVCGSYFVLTHTSTSINFAVLLNKPIIFMTSSDLEKSFLMAYLHNIAGWFGKQPVNIDHFEKLNLREELNVDIEKYKHYKECYIKKSGTPEKLAWQIFAEHTKRAFPI